MTTYFLSPGQTPVSEVSADPGTAQNDVFVEVPARDKSADPRERQVEAEADRFAAKTLIPPPHDRRLVGLKLPDVEAFAQMLDIAPAIVVGRMHHEEILPWNQGNAYRRRLKFVD